MRDLGGRVWTWLTSRSPRAYLLAGWLIFVAYAYPGLTTKDTFDQLAQARAGRFADDHPPLMAALWSVVDPLVAGTFGMLVLQSTTLLGGLYLLLRRATNARCAAVTASAILLFPPVLAPMAVVWKDCLMAGTLALGAALLLSDRRRTKAGGVVLLVVATALRYNAFAATLPLLALLGWSAPAVTWRRRVQRAGLALVLWIGVTVAALGVNRVLADRQMHFWHSSLAIMDIVGTLEFSATPVTDSSLRRTLDGTGLRIQDNIHATIHTRYRAGDFLHLVHGADPLFDLPLVDATAPASPATRAAIERAWRTIVFGRPLAYLQYRLDTFRVVLGFDDVAWSRVLVVTHPYQDRAVLERMGIPTGTSTLQARTGRALDTLSHTLLFRPWAYLLVALALLGLARRDRIAVAVLLSGLGLEASLLPLAGSPDFRYSHWMILCTVVGGAMTFAQRWRRGRGEVRA